MRNQRLKGENDIKKGIQLSFLIITTFVLMSCQEELELNSPPVIFGTDSQIRVGELLELLPDTYDPDGDELSFSIQGLPGWASFHSSSGLITGRPSIQNLGESYFLTVSVTDGKSVSSTEPFVLSVVEPIFFVGFEISFGVEEIEAELILKGCFVRNFGDICINDEESMVVEHSGTYDFEHGLLTETSFELLINVPRSHHCDLTDDEYFIGATDIIIKINCNPYESNELFDLNKLHKIRISMAVEEWERFLLDTERSTYLSETANGYISYNTWTHSEIYRKVDFEYLDDNNNTIYEIKNTGFKMKGNSTRQWPEYLFVDSDDQISMIPRRFSFTLKFDEEFDSDEGVYSCIDSNGTPSAIASHPCYSRIGEDLAAIPANSGRNLLGIQKLFFRINTNDPSYQRELLAHDILNRISVPASRVSHSAVELVIHGDKEYQGMKLPLRFNMGVFQMVEQVDHIFLDRQFGENGFLFKIGVRGDLAGSEEVDQDCIKYEEAELFFDTNICQIGIEKSDPISRQEWLGVDNYLNPDFVNSDINGSGGLSQFRPYKPTYDLKTMKRDIFEARNALIEFIKLIQSEPTDIELAKHFDINGFIKAQAAEIIMGAVDHYVRAGNNYYLYFNPTLKKWVYIPHDFDFVFRDNHTMSAGNPSWFNAFRDITSTYVFPSLQEENYWAARTLGINNPILWDAVFNNLHNRDLLYQEIRLILNEHFNWNDLNGVLEQRNDLVQDKIMNTEAVLPDGKKSIAYDDCGFRYDSRAIWGEQDTTICDSLDISIKEFIRLRKETLEKELIENGF